MKTHLVAAIGLTVCAALVAPSGCGSDVGSRNAGEETATQGEAMNRAFAPHFYTARRDLQWCNFAPCRGYFVKGVNADEPERRVSHLDFSSAHLDDGAIRAVEEAPLGDLVLSGTVYPDANGALVFGVHAAFRGMPWIDARPTADVSFYAVSDRDPPIECLVAPCDNEIATRLETDETTPFTTVTVDRAAAFGVDRAWLSDRILHHGAVVAGHFRTGHTFTGGPERVLDAGQVYVRLPDRGGPCALLHHVCSGGTRAVYTRSVDRCMVFQACLTPVACMPSRPAPCADGYTAARWATAGSACFAQVCDPAFLAE